MIQILAAETIYTKLTIPIFRVLATGSRGRVLKLLPRIFNPPLHHLSP